VDISLSVICAFPENNKAARKAAAKGNFTAIYGGGQ
jgi:hypothetical protein